MIRKTFICAGIVGTLLAMPVLATPAAADCRGFGCSLVQGIPIIGPAAQAVDQGIAGIKDRGSTADVLHQATGLNDLGFNNPIGQPAAPPVRMTFSCVTQVGVCQINNGPLPAGTPCGCGNPYTGGVDQGRMN
jgi:hypothetical protein